MGVTLKQIAAGALVAAAVLLPLRKPASTGRPSASTDRARRLDTLYWAQHNARQAWLAFDLDDSARALPAGTTAADGVPPIIWRGFSHRIVNTEADSLLRSTWARIGRTDGRVHTTVMLYDNRPYESEGYVGTRLVQRGDSTDCTAIAPGRTHTMPVEGVHVYDRELGDAIAPCVLLATFGPPGKGVGSWLATTRYASARSSSWLAPSASRFTNSPWAEWSNARPYFEPADGMASMMSAVGLYGAALLLRPPYELGATGLRCITGRQGDCVDGVLRPAIAAPPAEAMPLDLTLTTGRSFRDATTIDVVRPAAPGLISAMITEFGRDRFQKFWSSDRPFEEAFNAAFGESLGAWTARWAAGEWRTSYEARYATADIVLGVTVKPEWVPMTIAWSLLALAIAAWVARRRGLGGS